MSNDAVTAGASALDTYWAIGSLPCRNPVMKSGPRVLDMSKSNDSGGSRLAHLSVLECVELRALLVTRLGNQETSECPCVSRTTVGRRGGMFSLTLPTSSCCHRSMEEQVSLVAFHFLLLCTYAGFLPSWECPSCVSEMVPK